MRQLNSSSSCLLFVLIFISGFSGASAASEIVVPGLESDKIVEAWVKDELLMLKADNGRLYSVPLASVELTDFSFSPESPISTAELGPSLEDILDLIREGVSERNIRAFIETSTGRHWRLDPTAGDLVALKQAGASEELIQFLLSFDGFRPRTTTIAWKTPFSPRKDLPPSVPSKRTTSSTNINVQEGIPYFPYVYPGYGYTCPTYPVFPPRPVYPIEKQDSPNRTTPRPFYRPRQSSPPIATPYRRTRSASRGNQLWIRWSLPRAGGYASSQNIGEPRQATRPSQHYGTHVTGSSSAGIRQMTGSSSMGSSGARSTSGRPSRGSRGGSSGGRGAFSRARSNN